MSDNNDGEMARYYLDIDAETRFEVTFQKTEDDRIKMIAIEVENDEDKKSEVTRLVVPFSFEETFSLDDLVKSNHWWNGCENIDEVFDVLKNLFANRKVCLQLHNDYEFLNTNLSLKLFQQREKNFSINLKQKYVADYDAFLKALYEKEKLLIKKIDEIQPPR